MLQFKGLQKGGHDLVTEQQQGRVSLLYIRLLIPHITRFSQEMGIPDHTTCLLRKSYEDQEATVRSVPEDIEAAFRASSRIMSLSFQHLRMISSQPSDKSKETGHRIASVKEWGERNRFKRELCYNVK